MTQQKFITNLLESNKDAVIIGSLGTISYDLKEIAHNGKILIKGAMGAAVGCGIGYAMATKKQVIVLVGDGSFLMKLGSWATYLRYKPENLRVIILDNGVYKSCGNQSTSLNCIGGLPFEVVRVS